VATNIENMVVHEVSLVDKGANQHADVILYKRDGDALPGGAEDYLKREFTAEERQGAAESGAAMPDGSYPIKDKGDLHNAVQAIGRAKNPAATKRHIISRARTLGATGDLPADWKVSKVASDFEKAAQAFRDAVADVIGDDVQKLEAVDEYADELRKHVSDVVPLSKSQGAHNMPTDIEVKLEKATSDLTIAQTELAKAAGRVSTLETIVALPTSHRDYALAKSLSGASLEAFVKKTEAERDDEVATEKKKMEKAVMDMLPADIRKQLADNTVLTERLAKAEAAQELVAFGKRATEHGLPETFAPTLQKAYAADPAAIGELLTIVKGLTAQVATGVLFENFGKSNTSGTGATAYQRIVAAGEELRKTDSKLSKQQAVATIMKSSLPEHRELVALHKRETAVSA